MNFRSTQQGSNASQAPRRKDSRLFVALSVLAAAQFLFMSASAGWAYGSDRSLQTKRSVDSPSEVQLQVVLDTSASVPAAYRHQALQAIAGIVSRWPRPVAASGGTARQPSLLIQVRGVSGNSYAPEGVLGTWTIVGVPSVPALPKKVTADFTERVLAYKRAHASAVKACRHAVAGARLTAAALRSLRPKTTYASEIEGAVSAAAQSFSPSGIRRLLVVSDLAQNRPPQIAGSLRRVRVLIAHVCTTVSTCDKQQRTWTKAFRAREAAAVTFVRIERFPSAVGGFLGGR